jgi:hypothetical protein
MSCSVCNHPKRQEIDQALLDGATLAAVGKQFQLSTSALDRHKAHLRARVLRDKNRLHHNLQQYAAFWLSRALDMVGRIARAAEAEGNYKVSLQACRQGMDLLKLINKQDCQFDDAMACAILSSTKWASQSSLLPDDPEIMAMVRQSLTGSFVAPCPDTAPPPPGESVGDLQQLENMLSSLISAEKNAAGAPPVIPSPVGGKRQTANGLFKWEKSGKLPGKTLAKPVNPKNNQEDALWQKISGISRRCLAGPPVPAPDGKLAALLGQCGNIPGDIPLAEYLCEQSFKAAAGAPSPAAG